MARLPRFDLPYIPQHIVQLGNNRLPCFLDDDDRQRYLQLLRQAASTAKCCVHAYALMNNHVHLLATPEDSGAASLMSKCEPRPIAPLLAKFWRSPLLTKCGCICNSSGHWV
jgi:putative transposase